MIASAHRRQLLDELVLPSVVAQGFDECVVVGEYHSGSLTVATSKSGYYAVLDASGTQLVSKPVNQPVSLLPGNYSVKLGDNSRSATVTAGQSVVLNW